MASIKFFLKKGEGSTFPVMMRVSERTERAFFSTGFYATEDQFEEEKASQRFASGRGVAEFKVTRRENGKVVEYSNRDANNELAAMEERANAILKEYKKDKTPFTAQGFKQRFNGKETTPGENVAVYAAKMVEGYKLAGRNKKAIITTDALNSFRLFDSKFNKRKFADIDKEYISRYVEFAKGRGNSGNTIAIRLCEIRTILNDAINNGKGCPEKYPFKKTASGKGQTVKGLKETETKVDNYLPTSLLRKLATAKIDNPRLDQARHLFLFSFYCRGINFQDMARLTPKNIVYSKYTDKETGEVYQTKVIRYKRSKTKRNFEIQITDAIQRELDWFKDNCTLYDNFLLPIILHDDSEFARTQHIDQFRDRFNQDLRKVAKELEFPESCLNIAAYTARHTFAVAMQERGESTEVISEALGHQDLTTTRNYLSRFSNEYLRKHTAFDFTPETENEQSENENEKAEQ